MREAAFLFALLAGCRSPEADPANAAEDALRREQYEKGLRAVEKAIDKGPPATAAQVRLRLLKAELLLANRDAKQATAVLAFAVPAAGTGPEERARQDLYLGHAAMLLGRLEEAREKLDSAASLAQASNSARLSADVELRKGSLAVRTGDFHQAEAHFLRVLDFADQANDATLRLAATGNMGFLMLRSYRHEDAIWWFERTLGLARQYGAAVSEARALGNLGSTYFRLGDSDRAVPHLKDAEARFGQLGNEFEQQIWLGNLGNVFAAAGDNRQAIPYYGRALDLARSVSSAPWTATWLSNLAHTSIGAADWDAAEKYNQEALALKRQAKDRLAESYSLYNEGRIAAGRGDLVRAEVLFQKILDAALSDPVLRLEAQIGLAGTFDQAGHEVKAEREYRSALNAIDREHAQLVQDDNKLSYLASLIRFHQDYVEFLMRRNRAADALEVVEASRARILAGRLRKRSAPRGGLKASEIRHIAGSLNGTILSYWLAPKRSYFWAVTGHEITAYSLAPGAELCKAVESFNAVIQAQRDPLAAGHPSGLKLGDALLAPLSRAKLPLNRVVVVPDGCLHSLNFETIPVRSAQAHYWVEDATVAVTPWIGLLAGGRKAAPPGTATAPSALLIGDPDDAGRQYPKLEFAGHELRSIRESGTGYQWEVLDGPRARAAAYRQAGPGRFALIHFAAHAATNRESPLDSAIILSGESGPERLVARDLLATPLQAELVTISACQSVGAKTYAGEGLVGFSWVFLSAGASNVIASLWNVNDRSTAQMMTRLYAELGRGAPPEEALHRAKLELIRSNGPYRKPYYWAPFQIYAGSREQAGRNPR